MPQLLKRMVEKASGYRFKRLDGNAIACIPSQRLADAWFSYDLQLHWLLETQRIDLVVDVGANDGQFVERLRPLYKGEILSFEPVSAAFEQLAASASQSPNWHVYKLALGSVATSAVIHVADDTAFSSLLQVNAYSQRQFDRSVTRRHETVEVRRLDQVLPERCPDWQRRRIFLKMDTQGYDGEVFRGLGAVAPLVYAVQSELSLIPIYERMPHWTETIELYEQGGLQVVGMFPVNRDHGRVIEYDCLMVKAAAA